MFDTANISKTNSTTNFNSVSGILVKSHQNSVIQWLDFESPLGQKLFDITPTIKINYVAQPVVVLQIMLVSDKKCVVEYVLEKYFNSQYEEDKQ